MDETAGVDDDNIGVFRTGREFVPRAESCPIITSVSTRFFGTTETDKTNFQMCTYGRSADSPSGYQPLPGRRA